MPKCKNCNSQFPCRKYIDGKLRNLQRRKFCLDCSPFNSGNRRASLGDNDVICIECKREYSYKRSSGHTKTTCNSCMANRRKHKIKVDCIDYKGGQCSLCGYAKCITALSFHHINPEEKDFNISGSHTRRWSSIKRELDKCILVCMNCHAEIHYEERN